MRSSGARPQGRALTAPCPAPEGSLTTALGSVVFTTGLDPGADPGLPAGLLCTGDQGAWGPQEPDPEWLGKGKGRLQTYMKAATPKSCDWRKDKASEQEPLPSLGSPCTQRPAEALVAPTSHLRLGQARERSPWAVPLKTPSVALASH